MRERHSTRRYPRTARLNEALREVLAEEIERLYDDDPRLEMVTITGIDTEADLRHATVYYSSLGEHTDDALGEQRHRLQAAIARQLRIKRTPQLSFVLDPAVTSGRLIEDILRGLHEE